LQNVVIQLAKAARLATHPHSFPPASEQAHGVSEHRLALQEQCTLVSRLPGRNTRWAERRLRYHCGSPNVVFTGFKKFGEAIPDTKT
jgi:hypothetical protein